MARIRMAWLAILAAGGALTSHADAETLTSAAADPAPADEHSGPTPSNVQATAEGSPYWLSLGVGYAHTPYRIGTSGAFSSDVDGAATLTGAGAFSFGAWSLGLYGEFAYFFVSNASCDSCSANVYRLGALVRHDVLRADKLMPTFGGTLGYEGVHQTDRTPVLSAEADFRGLQVGAFFGLRIPVAKRLYLVPMVDVAAGNFIRETLSVRYPDGSSGGYDDADTHINTWLELRVALEYDPRSPSQ